MLIWDNYTIIVVVVTRIVTIFRHIKQKKVINMGYYGIYQIISRYTVVVVLTCISSNF